MMIHPRQDRSPHHHIQALLESRNATADFPAPSPSPSPSFEQCPPRSSYSPSEYSHADHFSAHHITPRLDNSRFSLEDQDQHEFASQRDSIISIPPEDSAPEARLSVMGPKVKLFSRAPWEDGDIMEEPEELCFDDSAEVSSLFGGKRGRDRSKTVTKVPDDGRTWKGFTMVTSKSKDTDYHQGLGLSVPHSTRSTSASRSSTDSGRPDYHDDDVSPKQSPLSHKYSMPKLGARARTLSSSNSSMSRSDSVVSSILSSPSSSSFPPVPSLHPDVYALPTPSPSGRNISNTRSTSPTPTNSSGSSSSSTRNVHPFANPEIFSSAYTPPIYKQRTPQLRIPLAGNNMVKSESYDTLKSGVSTLLTPSTTFNQSSPSKRSMKIHDDVSSSASSDSSIGPSSSTPLTPSSRSNSDDVPAGMLGFPGSQVFNLITLEQAREKVRERSKTGGVVVHGKHITSIDDVSMGKSEPPPSPHGARKLPPRPPICSLNTSPDLPPLPTPPSPALPPLPTSSSNPPAHKTIKNKRSGFLNKFFKEGKDGKDKERPSGVVITTPRLASVPFPKSSSSEQIATMSSSAPPMPPIPTQYKTQKSWINTRSSKERLAPASKKNANPLSLSVIVSSPPDSTRGRNRGVPGSAIEVTSSPSPSGRLFPINSQPSHESTDDAEGTFQSLKLRPVSSLFSAGLPSTMLSSPPLTGRARGGGLGNGIPEDNVLDESLISPISVDSIYSQYPPSASTTASWAADPITPLSTTSLSVRPTLSASDSYGSGSSNSSFRVSASDAHLEVAALHSKISELRKTWRLQAWEYEAQIRALQTENAELKARACHACGERPSDIEALATIGSLSVGVLDRPRLKTGAGSRFASGWDGAE